MQADLIPGGLGAFALVVAAIVVALILLLVWLLSRDRDVTRTSFGFYVERRRFNEPERWPQLEPPEHQSMPAWQDRTAELPPNLPPEKP